MNWKQYFELKDKRRGWVKKFFFLLCIIHIALFWRKLLGGAEVVCGNICPLPAELNLTNQSINITQGYFQDFVPRHVWYDCTAYCQGSEGDVEESILTINKVFFGPAFILVYFIIALILAWSLYFIKMAGADKPKAEEKKEDKKEEKK